MCACITKDGFIVMQQQYRFPLRRVSLDYPAGSFERTDKGLKEAALRELREETGFSARTAKRLFSLSKDPSFFSGTMHVFLAVNALKVDNPQQDREYNSVVLLRPREVLNAVNTEEISCAFCVATTLRTAEILKWNR